MQFRVLLVVLLPLVASQTCGEQSPSCANEADVVNASAPCTMPCDSTQCCVEATSCSQFQLGSYCADVSLVPNSTRENEPCPGMCSRNWCCRPAEYCGEYPGISSICYQASLIVDSDADCAGSACADSQVCCTQPKICNDVSMIDPNFCYSVGQSWNSSSRFLQCDGGCTTDFCCELPTNCQNAPGACAPGMIRVVADQNCTDCASECCVPPQTCDELFSTDTGYCMTRNLAPTQNATLRTQSCGGPCTSDVCCVPTCSSAAGNIICPQPKIFDYSAPCTACNEAECCRAPEVCHEVSNSLQCGPGEVVDSMTSCTSCNETECCRPIEACGEADLYMTCNDLGLYLDMMLPCNASTCSVELCCRVPLQCSEQPWSTCANNGLVKENNNPGSCPSTGCTVADCCRAPQICDEATQVSPDMCLGLGQAVTGPCADGACNATGCCRPPETCQEVESATSYLQPGWCSQQGFASRGVGGLCTGACTAEQCCAPNICANWGQLPGAFGSRCPAGRVLDGSATCDDDTGCDAEACCRAPTQCRETIFAVLCPSGFRLADQPCSGASCNETTCCAPTTSCAEVASTPMCDLAGMGGNSSGGTCNGPCTVSQCCVPPTSCDSIDSCPSGLKASSRPCQGAQCSVDYCCTEPRTCADALSGGFGSASNLCDGYGFPANEDEVCGAACTKDICCRSPITCGEVDVLTGLCGGAVDYFKPCQGAECTKAFCCRAPLNCREAVRSGSVMCSPGVPAHLNEVACPSGVCDQTNCCKPVATCGDENVLLNGTLCSGAMKLSSSLACGGSTPCNAATCCLPPADCEEAMPFISCTGNNTVFNEAAAQDACSPTCTAAQCCRSPFSCGEAYLTNPQFCGSLQLSYDVLALPCSGNCVATCCKTITFAPTHAPTHAPTSGTPTTPTLTSAPTTPTLTSAPTTHAPSAPSTKAPSMATNPGNNDTISGSAVASASVALLGALLCFAS